MEGVHVARRPALGVGSYATQAWREVPVVDVAMRDEPCERFVRGTDHRMQGATTRLGVLCLCPYRTLELHLPTSY
jgi:hypothetical protein